MTNFLQSPQSPKHFKCIRDNIDTGTHFPIQAQKVTNLCCVKKSGGLYNRKIQNVDF